MATIEQEAEVLVAGDKLSRAEFLRRWEAMPHVKKAELIGGIVYMPSPLSRDHGMMDRRVGTWLGNYEDSTPGTEGARNATWLMLEDAPQPYDDLRIVRAYGGKSKIKGRFATGAPELASEICLTSAAYDLHQKMELYRKAGVNEYLAVLLRDQKVRWHRLVRGAYRLLPTSADGVIRSVIFPGLWLHAQALLKGDMHQVLATLQQGLDSPEHARFVAELAAKRK